VWVFSDFTKLLGLGAHGAVYKGLLRGFPVAIKTVNKNAGKSYLKALLSELKIMIYLGKHEHVMEFIGSDTTGLHKGKHTFHTKRSLHNSSFI